MNIIKKFDILLGLPKSIILNFKYLKFREAVKLPILVSRKVKFKMLRGRIKIESKIKTGMIQIGLDNIDIFEKNKINNVWKVEGKIIFKGKAILKNGVKVNVAKSGELILGKNILINNQTSIVCNKKVTIGDNSLVSWECLIMDTDFHKIENQSGKIINHDKEISISDNVWIGCRATILKGSIIGDNSVIASNSVVCSELVDSNNIYGGNPAKKIKSDINWRV